jgi:hypothetical protein
LGIVPCIANNNLFSDTNLNSWGVILLYIFY